MATYTVRQRRFWRENILKRLYDLGDGQVFGKVHTEPAFRNSGIPQDELRNILYSFKLSGIVDGDMTCSLVWLTPKGVEAAMELEDPTPIPGGSQVFNNYISGGNNAFQQGNRNTQNVTMSDAEAMRTWASAIADQSSRIMDQSVRVQIQQNLKVAREEAIVGRGLGQTAKRAIALAKRLTESALGSAIWAGMAGIPMPF